VANCSEVKYNAHVKNNIKFADFIDYLKDFHRKEDDRECLYLKDWHFVRYVHHYIAFKVFVCDICCRNHCDDILNYLREHC